MIDLAAAVLNKSHTDPTDEQVEDGEDPELQSAEKLHMLQFDEAWITEIIDQGTTRKLPKMFGVSL